MNFGQNLSNFVDGLSTFLIGVTVVFVTLVLLIGIIVTISKIVASIENVGNKNKKEAVATPAVKEPVAEATTTQDELELVAVITAAIAASLGTTSDRLQVRSLRKVARRSR